MMAEAAVPEIDIEERLREVKTSIRALMKEERDLVYKLGGEVVSREDTSATHAELRKVRERLEELFAAELLLG